MALIINRDLANSVGVNPSTVAGAVSTAVRGSDLPRFNSKGRHIPVRLRLNEEDRSELDDINNMLVPTEDGRFSSIGTISRPAMLKSEEYIRRTNRKLSYTFGIKLKEGQEKTAKDNIKAKNDISEFVSYEDIIKNVKDIINKGHTPLIENLAQNIADKCLINKRILKIEIMIEKLETFKEAESVGIKIIRMNKK